MQFGSVNVQRGAGSGIGVYVCVQFLSESYCRRGKSVLLWRCVSLARGSGGLSYIKSNLIIS